MFSRLLGFFVIAIAISNQACSQETTLNAFRRKPIVIPYKGEDLSVDEYLKTDAAIEHEKEKWWKVCDRQLRFSPLEFNELCNNFVGVKLITARSPIKINAIGFEAVPLVYDAHRKEWSEFAQSIRAQVVDQSLSDEKFFNFLLTLREDVSRFWKKIRTKDAPEVLCIQAELADHLSLIRKQNECWLTVAIEIVSDENNEGFFATELRKRLAPQQNRAIRPLADIPQRIEPHPMTEEDIETLIRKPRPLQANRSAIASKSVQNDKLTNLERASLYHFEAEDERNLQKHQIEGIGSRASIITWAENNAIKTGVGM